MKILLVAGSFDDKGGKTSGYATKLNNAIEIQLKSNIHFENGGYWKDFKKIIDTVALYDVAIWMADIPNDKPKIVQDIKKNNPRCLLVTSKRNNDSRYEFMELLSRSLEIKSNLFIQFVKNKNGMIKASLYDPLGVCYCNNCDKPEELARALSKRISFLKNMTRVNSRSIGKAIVPEDDELFKIVRGYAETFHDLIQGINTARMLGNCSFRCTEGGFPSVRQGDYIFVSRRNIDKRDIGRDGMVAVSPLTALEVLENNIYVNYFGDKKPSVDTPIQLALYALYPNINYIIHSHVYVHGAPKTREPIPCGAMQELDEIMRLYPKRNADFFTINLIGHGSIVGAKNIENLKNLNYIPRKMPEII